MSVNCIVDWEMSQGQSVCVCPVSESNSKGVFGTWKSGKDGKYVFEPMKEGLYFLFLDLGFYVLLLQELVEVRKKVEKRRKMLVQSHKKELRVCFGFL